MASSDSSRHLTGISCVVFGIALVQLGRAWDGFRGGLVTGAAVALLLVGVVLLSSSWRKGAGWLPSRDERGDQRGDWLPSRDEERR